MKHAMKTPLTGLLLGTLFSLPTLSATALAAPELTMEQIMAHPDWIATSPEQPMFSADGKQVYYQRKIVGSELRDLYRANASGGDASKLAAADVVMAETDERMFSADRKQAAWLRNGNLFIWRDGKRKQLSRTGESGELLGFVGADQLALRDEGKVLLLDLRSGMQSLLATLKTEDDPAAEKDEADYLSAQQTRLFDIIKLREKRKAEREARQTELATQVGSAPAPIYLGKGRELKTVSLSPDARYLIVGTIAPKRDGRADKMPHYVSADGYVKADEVRSKVGTDQADDETLYLIELASAKASKLAFDSLPGINEDPLLALKTEVAKRAGKDAPKSDAPRAVYVHDDWTNGDKGVRWSQTGKRVAIDLFSYDNKDRWLVEVDLSKASLQTLHRLTDAAWVNDSEFNEFGWLPDEKAFWYLSEESGYSQLYLLRDGKASALTRGTFEVNRVQTTIDGSWFYYRANKEHPGIHEVYRVSRDGKRDEAVTDLNGGIEFELAPSDDKLLLVHSKTTQPPELFVQAAAPGAKARQLTHTVTPEFATIDWVKPEIIAIPSKHGAAPIYSRVYRDAQTKAGERKPAVMFVHGAGYLQNAHHGWSSYFREYMFHNLLLKQGYVVIDMDYRASEGYGRDWRTAIYQRMGTPELEDYLDGVDWLVDNANVDRQRIGIYGGSYGGFMAFMALFKTPDVFAAGAALRPVTDWAHYNHGYTANILNTPQVDPDAYARSSPIEFAAALKRPLLICTGMLDDNVFFQDSVRLVQRLIELKNPNFELAVYPIEPHGFREPESWLDEYRRIYKLMEREVKGRQH
jgi:dipeptidyl aminopeptidase/acylaminoacyl peptidase